MMRFSSEDLPTYFIELTGTHHMHNDSGIKILDFSRDSYLASSPQEALLRLNST